jgi:hypothetical protein
VCVDVCCSSAFLTATVGVEWGGGWVAVQHRGTCLCMGCACVRMCPPRGGACTCVCARVLGKVGKEEGASLAATQNWGLRSGVFQGRGLVVS